MRAQNATAVAETIALLDRLKTELPKQTIPATAVRKLKIEADGDFWMGLIKPKIRLKGHWLERAGFSPGGHVRVTCIGFMG